MLMVVLVLLAGGIAWYYSSDGTSEAVRTRIYKEISDQGKRPSLLGRLVELLQPINQYLPAAWISRKLVNRLEAGGVRMSPLQFFVIQELFCIGSGILIYVITFGSLRFNLGWFLLFSLLGFFVPQIWLFNRIQSRRQSVSRDLPEVVDLLSLCVDAGMDFMNALARVVKEYRSCPTTEELSITIQEVRVGKRRRDALRAFAARMQTPDTSSFTRTLVQADRMGSGIAEALQILSEDMRIKRYHWAERYAQQAPVKMLLPLLFSLATALIIVAGPIMAQFLSGGFDVNALNSRASQGAGAE
jgi:tight adherence protein C